MKVLVVDDDVVSRMVLMHLIDSCGKFDIVEAEDGADAWRQLQDGLRPAICFCDLRMPHLSGMELLQRVKADPELAGAPFVLVTSANDQDTVDQALAGGAAGYVVKPFQAPQVREQLAGLLEVPAAASAPCAPGAAADAVLAAEAPQATLVRLGIKPDRLLVYLNGFQNQLNAAAADLDVLLAQDQRQEAQSRLERLYTGCITLGLHGAAEALRTLSPGGLSAAAISTVLSGVQCAVGRQSELVRQAASA